MKSLVVIAAITLVMLSPHTSVAKIITHKNSPWATKEAPPECLGKVGLTSDLIYENPYSVQGKCYLVQTPPYTRNIQYLDRSSAVFFLSERIPARDTHPVLIRYHGNLIPQEWIGWLVGTGTFKYQDASGAQRIIPTLKVAKMRDVIRHDLTPGDYSSDGNVENWSKIKKDAPPQCDKNLGLSEHLFDISPYATEGICYYLHSERDKQFLYKNMVLYIFHDKFGHRGKHPLLIDFAGIDVPSPKRGEYGIEYDDWHVYVVGIGVFQYTSANGRLMTVPKVKVIKLINEN